MSSSLCTPPISLSLLQWQSAQAEHEGIEQWMTPTQQQTPAYLAWVDYLTPAVIYGRRGGNTPERQVRAQDSNHQLLVRRSGGGAVLAGPWLLGFHLWIPQAHRATKLSAVQCMREVGTRVAQVLRTLNESITLASAEDMVRITERIQAASLQWNCFAGLSHGELLDTTGRKCLGLSQARVATGALISGGLLTHATPWALLDFIHHGGDSAQSFAPSLTQSLVSDGITVVHAQQRDVFKHRLALSLANWLNATLQYKHIAAALNQSTRPSLETLP